MTAELARHADVDAAMVAASKGCAFAMIEDGYALVGGALQPVWHGRAELWCLISKFARPRHLVLAARVVRDMLDAKQRDPAYRSVECYLREDPRWHALGFARAMGFKDLFWLPAWDQAGRDHWFARRVFE